MSAAAPPAEDLTHYELDRFNEARLVGLTRVEAFEFAVGDQPLRLLWRLAAEGCDGRLIARIVV